MKNIKILLLGMALLLSVVSQSCSKTMNSADPKDAPNTKIEAGYISKKHKFLETNYMIPAVPCGGFIANGTYTPYNSSTHYQGKDTTAYYPTNTHQYWTFTRNNDTLSIWQDNMFWRSQPFFTKDSIMALINPCVTNPQIQKLNYYVDADTLAFYTVSGNDYAILRMIKTTNPNLGSNQARSENSRQGGLLGGRTSASIGEILRIPGMPPIPGIQ